MDQSWSDSDRDICNGFDTGTGETRHRCNGQSPTLMVNEWQGMNALPRSQPLDERGNAVMTFGTRLHTIVAPFAVATHEERAADTVALHAPYLLRHFAALAAELDEPGMRSGRGAIWARRDDRGYAFVEFTVPGLHIVFTIVDGDPLLYWIAGNETDRRCITAETPSCALDAVMLDAVSAFTNTRAAAVAGDRASEMEARHG
jgi:hypothetical protein